MDVQAVKTGADYNAIDSTCKGTGAKYFFNYNCLKTSVQLNWSQLLGVISSIASIAIASVFFIVYFKLNKEYQDKAKQWQVETVGSSDFTLKTTIPK